MEEKRGLPEAVFFSVLEGEVQVLGYISELLLVASVSHLEKKSSSPDLGVGAHGKDSTGKAQVGRLRVLSSRSA